MTDKKQQVEITHKTDNELNYLSELQIISLNYQVCLKSNRVEENLYYLASLGLNILSDLKKIEKDENI